VVLREGLHKSNDAMSYIHRTDAPRRVPRLARRAMRAGWRRKGCCRRTRSLRAAFARRL